jgi:hypothetical protein
MNMMLPSTTVSSQQIVEVMGDARGKLAHSLEALHLTQRALDPFTLLDLRQQLPIGGGQFAGTLVDAKFQLLIQPPALVLTAPASQTGLRDTDKCGGMKRPLEERDVAEDLREQRRGGISLYATTVTGQQDEWKVRPRRLTFDPLGERPRIA